MEKSLRVGVDIGGVIFVRDKNDFKPIKMTDGKQKKKILATRKKIQEQKDKMYVVDAIDGLQKLAAIHTVFLISYCQSSMEEICRKDLRRENIPIIISEERWIFVQKRQAKALVCQELKMDMMIDDRLDVLNYIRQLCGDTVQTFWFAGDPSIKSKHTVVKDWQTLSKHLKLC